ncbi:unnamed protein product [Protopolystoma xenopodis]|uniref:Uncharacterized protein n=1 Tax=Protopolystoma xenopodis TaxID=117903 RepID=A0A448X9H5_9PLAT|nr:unnamed protein product [Protopolystoma xenopodis]
MAERGLRTIDTYLFDEHHQLRRAAAECYNNMAQYPPFVLACGGRLPLDETLTDQGDLGKKLILPGGTDRIKLLLLYCLATNQEDADGHQEVEQDDLSLVLACSGALATMSYDPGIIDEIAKVSLF